MTDVIQNSANTGLCLWVTGLPGSGKTTLALLLQKQLKSLAGRQFVLLDGDELREVFGSTTLHQSEQRKNLSYQYARLARLLCSQGVDVIVSTVSMFEDVRQWNRKNITNYLEVFIDVPIEVLINRDKHGLYSGAMRGEVNNVLGINASYEAPLTPDIRICPMPEDVVDKSLKQLIDELKLKIVELNNEN